MKLGGDPDAPLNLSGLTDAELAFFRRIMVKIGATTGLVSARRRMAAQERPPATLDRRALMRTFEAGPRGLRRAVITGVAPFKQVLEHEASR